MKIQRYAPTLTVKTTDNGAEYPFADMRESMDGNFFKRSDILPLLNPWKDTENEKPDTDNDILIKFKYTDGSLAYSVGYYDPILGFYELYSNYFNDCKIVEWMHIPKNEGEE